MIKFYLFFYLLALFLLNSYAFPKRLVFELQDGERFCLYETLNAEKSYHFQFRVLRGGSNDVNVVIKDSSEFMVKEMIKSFYDQHEWQPATSGLHSFCFDNSFSTISHKLIFFELRDKDFETLDQEGGVTPHATVETQLEMSAEFIHKELSAAEDIQTDLRSKERSDRYILFDLHMRVTFWSTITTIVIFITAIGQVTLVKSLFPDRPKSLYSHVRP